MRMLEDELHTKKSYEAISTPIGPTQRLGRRQHGGRRSIRRVAVRAGFISARSAERSGARNQAACWFDATPPIVVEWAGRGTPGAFGRQPGEFEGRAGSRRRHEDLQAGPSGPSERMNT
jgi:hypothetical protein